MNVIINILIFILILGFIIFIHEFGHFTLAKLRGVFVYEFSMGMGPLIFSKKIGETEYSLRAIPIGGYCALAGEDVEYDESKKIPKNRRLQNKKPWERFLIMFFGAGNNFLSAFVILFLIALIWGGSTMDPFITEVTPGSAADKAGIVENSKVLKINGNKIKTSDDISLFLAVADPKEGSTFTIENNGIQEDIKVVPKKTKVNGKESYIYGVGMKQKETHGFVNAIKYMCVKSSALFRQMYYTVKYLFTGHVGLNQMSGPVGIYSIVGAQREGGFVQLLYLLAFLSINVGFLNLLPLPAFDGGHILFILIELIRGKPVDPKVENIIHSIGMALLMLLMLIVTVNDIIKLF